MEIRILTESKEENFNFRVTKDKKANNSNLDSKDNKDSQDNNKEWVLQAKSKLKTGILGTYPDLVCQWKGRCNLVVQLPGEEVKCKVE